MRECLPSGGHSFLVEGERDLKGGKRFQDWVDQELSDRLKGMDRQTNTRMDYWTEEQTIPLYVVSDRRQLPFSRDFLCLYGSGTSRLYFLGNRWEEEKSSGRLFFGREGSVDYYVARSAGMTEFLGGFSSADRSFRFPELTAALRDWQALYFLTEAVRLEGIETDLGAPSEAALHRIAEARFGLRKAFEGFVNGPVDRFLRETSGRYGLSEADLDFYTFDEIRRLLDGHGRVDPAVLECRMGGYAFCRSGDVAALDVGDDARRKWEVSIDVSREDIQELRGRCVSPGIARGVVHVLRHDRPDIRGRVSGIFCGCVLVTEMTRPQTVMACRKAKAIVTDEGGITSHAAVLSRELGVPCVVGTGMATRVLKDGDIVEVDAYQGIVRIVRRPEK